LSHFIGRSARLVWCETAVMGCNVIWFRRDLRLADHPAIQECARRGVVVPLFILDPALLVHPETAPARVQFLLQSLRALDADLRRRGARLLVRRGDPLAELVRVVKASRADAVFALIDHERLFGRRRDAAVQARLAQERIPLQWLEPPGGCPALLPYPCWQQHWHQEMAVAPALAPPRLQAPSASPALPDHPIPSLEELGLRPDGKPLPPAGTAAALARLETFCQGQASRRYYWELSYPAARATSGLSPYLKFGVVSARQCLQRLQGLGADDPARARSARQLASRLRWGAAMHQRFRYLPQLELCSLWRSYDQPSQASGHERDPGDPLVALEPAPLSGAAAELYCRWQEGSTGFPIVDAAARCLMAEGGWLELNFRSRAIYASFLVNLCGIDWRWGALHFMRHLIDGDCPIDHYQWAMQAGVTVRGEAAWTRIYHPGQVAVDRCDPQGEFIRRWLPELAELTNDQLGQPPAMAGYPRPLLDYDSARRQRLQTLQQQRRRIGDVRHAIARLPEAWQTLPLWPAAVPLDGLSASQWNALLSWFTPARPAAPRPQPAEAPAVSPRRRGRPRQDPGQLSLDLGL
jgi:deoxyribodipyrimidine photo-lyase